MDGWWLCNYVDWDDSVHFNVRKFLIIRPTCVSVAVCLAPAGVWRNQEVFLRSVPRHWHQVLHICNCTLYIHIEQCAHGIGTIPSGASCTNQRSRPRLNNTGIYLSKNCFITNSYIRYVVWLVRRLFWFFVVVVCLLVGLFTYWVGRYIRFCLRRTVKTTDWVFGTAGTRIRKHDHPSIGGLSGYRFYLYTV